MNKIEQNPLAIKSGDVFPVSYEELLKKEKDRVNSQAEIIQELSIELDKLKQSSKEVSCCLRQILNEFKINTKIVDGSFIADESFNIKVLKLLRKALKELKNK